jgi:multicomponent Na+:H+ antiporter subunit E
MNKIPHALSLGIFLGALWVLLSGYFTPLLLFFGLVSVCLVVYLALRMDVVDHEGHPVHLKIRLTISYWLWLLKEIVISNIDVCRRILSPGMPISPVVIKIKSTQATGLGHVIYANSITLTPGTVSMNVDGDMIEVHALTGEGAANLEAGEMNRRVMLMENYK